MVGLRTYPSSHSKGAGDRGTLGEAATVASIAIGVGRAEHRTAIGEAYL